MDGLSANLCGGCEDGMVLGNWTFDVAVTALQGALARWYCSGSTSMHCTTVGTMQAIAQALFLLLYFFAGPFCLIGSENPFSFPL